MIRSKRLLAVGLVAALGLAAAACGGDDDDDAGSGERRRRKHRARRRRPQRRDHDRGHHRRGRHHRRGGHHRTGGHHRRGRHHRRGHRRPRARPHRRSRPRRSACCSTSPVAATSRSTTPRPPASTRPRSRSARPAPSRRRPATATAPSGSRACSVRTSDLVIGVGFLWTGPAVGRRRQPGPAFGLIDAVAVDDQGTPDDFADDVPLQNVASMKFAEEQGSFLVGAAAALKSETDTVGFVGGVETDLIKKFEAGFIAGVAGRQPGHRGPLAVHHAAAGLHRLQRPGEGQGDRRVDVRATAPTSSTRPPAAPASACSRPPARPASPATCGPSASTATSTTSSTPTLQPYILTSMLKKVDVAVYETIEQLADGEFARRPAGVRPRARRRRLLDDGRLRRRHHGPARRVQAADHRRRDRGADHSLMRDRAAVRH